jgi:hypothetical protein
MPGVRPHNGELLMRDNVIHVNVNGGGLHTRVIKPRVYSRRYRAMKGLLGIFFILLLFAVTISPAYANCTKDGKSYPEGTTVGGFICIKGKWVRR